MKKLLLLSLALLVYMTAKGSLSFQGLQDSSKENLVVLLKSGETFYFMLEESPKITFKDQKMCVSTKTEASDIEIINIVKFYFSDSANRIENLKTDEFIIRYINNDNITIEGVSSPSVRIYTVDGKLMMEKKHSTGNETSVSLESLASGIYILSINNSTSIKIYKK